MKKHYIYSRWSYMNALVSAESNKFAYALDFDYICSRWSYMNALVSAEAVFVQILCRTVVMLACRQAQ